MSMKHTVLSACILLVTAGAYAQAPYWMPTGGPGQTNVTIVVSTTSQDLYAGTLGDGIFFSSNGGRDWLPRNNGLTNLGVRAIREGTNSRMYAGAGDGSVYSSDNQGASWNSMSPTGIGEIYTLEATPGGALFAGGNGGLCRSTDEGVTWELLDFGMPQPLIFGAVRHIRDDILVAGSLGMGAFRSTDNGTTWEQSFAGSPDNIVHSLFPYYGVVLAGTALGVFRSADEGITWSELADPDGANVIDIVAATDYYSVTLNGVFRSTDSGQSWLAADDGLEDIGATCIALGPTFYLGTNGAGVYEALSVNSADPDPDETPLSFHLRQNYPNPFNSVSNFEFGITLVQNRTPESSIFWSVVSNYKSKRFNWLPG